MTKRRRATVQVYEQKTTREGIAIRETFLGGFEVRVVNWSRPTKRRRYTGRFARLWSKLDYWLR